MSALKRLSRLVLGIAFIGAGINHFWHPALYLRIMPPYLPWHRFLVDLSGLLEILLGALVLLPRFRRAAASGLIALLIAIFPANLHMALHPEQFPAIPPAVLWFRLPFQALFIAWAAWHRTGDG